MPGTAFVLKEFAHSFFRIVSAFCVILAVFCLPEGTSAQETNIPPEEQVASEVSNAPVGTQSKPIVYSKNDLRLANRTVTLANRTLKSSREAFRRGLLDYTDYEVHLKTALKMKLTAAEVLEDRKLKNRFIQNYRTTIDESERLLKRFHQLGTEGWAGDLKQAEILATEARQLSATFDDNQKNVKNMNRLRNRQSLELLKFRTHDYRRGFSSISQWNDAAINTTNPQWNDRYLKSHRLKKEQPTKKNPVFNRFQRRMKRELEEVSRRSSSSAGIGRSDRSFERQTKLRQSKTLHSGNANRNRQSQILDRQNVKLQRRLYRTKTTSLFDLTRSWLYRQQEIEESRRNRRSIDPNRSRLHKNDFDGIVDRARGITDLRGRNAADVSLVKSLEHYSRLSESVFKKQEEAIEREEKRQVEADLTGFLRIQFR